MDPGKPKIRMDEQPALTPGKDKAWSAQLRGGQGRSGLETGGEPFSLADYARLAQMKDLSVDSIYRGVVCNLPRCLHQLDAEMRDGS